MMGRSQSRAVLAAVASGASLSDAMAIGKGHTLDPPLVSTLLLQSPEDRRVRVAELAIEALREHEPKRTKIGFPAGLLQTSFVLFAVTGVMRIYVWPALAKMESDFNIPVGNPSFGLAVVLTIIAFILGAIGAWRTADRYDPTNIAAVLLTGLLLPLRARSQNTAETTLRWLAAGAAAEVPPARIMAETNAKRSIRSAAAGAQTAWDVVVRWARNGPQVVQNVASGIIEGEDEATAIRRVANVASTAQIGRDDGAPIVALGFGVLALAVFVLVAPIFKAISLMGSLQ